MKVFHGLNIPAKYWNRSARDDLRECVCNFRDSRRVCDICDKKTYEKRHNGKSFCGCGHDMVATAKNGVRIFGRKIADVEAECTGICQDFGPRWDLVPTLCCNCERAVRGHCPWRESGEPYPGWEAARNDIVDGDPSYRVISCPGYVATWEQVTLVRKNGHKKELMVRAVKLKPEQIDDLGCTALMEKVAEVAKKDYLFDPNERKKVSKFVRSSPYFAEPEPIIKWLKSMARIFDLNPKLRRRYLSGDESLDGYVPPKVTAKHSSYWIVFNRYEQIEFAECANCGREAEKPYPRVCPGCGYLMAREDPAELL